MTGAALLVRHGSRAWRPVPEREPDARPDDASPIKYGQRIAVKRKRPHWARCLSACLGKRGKVVGYDESSTFPLTVKFETRLHCGRTRCTFLPDDLVRQK